MSELPGGELHKHHHHHLSEEIQHLGHVSEMSEKISKAVDDIDEKKAKTSRELESQKKLLRTIKIEAFAIPIITILGVALSIGASTYWNTEQQRIAHIYSQASEIKEDMNMLFSTRNNLMDAMVQARAIRDLGQLHCKNGQYEGKDPKYQEKLFSAVFKLVNATYNADGVFAPKVMDKIDQFLYLADIDRIGICEQGAATEKELRPLQRTTNVMILEQVDELRKKRESLLKKLK